MKQRHRLVCWTSGWVDNWGRLVGGGDDEASSVPKGNRRIGGNARHLSHRDGPMADLLDFWRVWWVANDWRRLVGCGEDEASSVPKGNRRIGGNALQTQLVL